jgi:hypothetical protein
VATVLTVVGIGVLIGVQQLRYHEFSELGRVANRTLNQRHVIANDVSIRRAAESLGACTSLAQFCKILHQCLEPIGFDGFGVYLSSELPGEVERSPFNNVNRSNVQFFSNQLVTSSEVNWSLTFNLMKQNGERLGGFALYRKNPASPLWIDLDVFTATGFSSAVASKVEKMQDSWFAKTQNARTQLPALETPGPRVASGVRQPLAVPSSG